MTGPLISCSVVCSDGLGHAAEALFPEEQKHEPEHKLSHSFTELAETVNPKLTKAVNIYFSLFS